MKPYKPGMTKEEIVDRLLIAIASYDEKLEKRVESGKVTKKDIKKLDEALHILEKYPVWIPDKTFVSPIGDGMVHEC